MFYYVGEGEGMLIDSARIGFWVKNGGRRATSSPGSSLLAFFSKRRHFEKKRDGRALGTRLDGELFLNDSQKGKCGKKDNMSCYVSQTHASGECVVS